MTQLTLISKDQFKFLPTCYAPLYNFTGALYHQQYDLPHPAIMINKSWGKFIGSVLKFLDLYDAKSTDPTGQDLHEIEQAYEDILYLATELIESMLDNLKKCLLPKDKWEHWRLDTFKRWRDHPTAICNKIKHNNNFLVSLEGAYKFGLVRGYSLCHHVNDAIKPNHAFHSKQAAFAYGNDLRKIMSHIYLIGDAIRIQIEEILFKQQKASETLEFNSSSVDQDILHRVSKFMPLSFHYQKAQDIAQFRFDEQTLYIGDSDGQYIPPGDGMMKTYYSGDGYTRTFHVF